MKEKREVYKQHAILEDIDGEDGRIHMNLANLDLDITKDVDVSYYLPNKEDGHKDEKISFKEFKDRMINNQEFRENVFVVIVDGEDYEIRLSGGEMWVSSLDKKKVDSIFKILTQMNKIDTKVINYPNGDHYKGELKFEKPHGEGVMIYSLLIDNEERKRLKKQMKRGYYNFFHPYMYDGEWKNGLYHGEGIIKYTVGHVYEGEFKNGEYHNNGKLVGIRGIDLKMLEEFVDSGVAWADFMLIYKERKLNNYEIYEGDWKDGKKHGDGSLIRINHKGEERYKYEGEWKDGKKYGSGTFIDKRALEDLALECSNPDVRDSEKPKYKLEEYEGEWRDDKPHGYGVGKYVGFHRRSKYVGQYKNGKYHGKGTLQYEDALENDGAQMVKAGEFKDGKLIT